MTPTFNVSWGRYCWVRFWSPYDTHLIVNAPCATVGRLALIDTTNNKVDEAVANLALEAVDIVTGTGGNETLGICELAVPTVIGKEDKVGCLMDRLGQVLGVEVEGLADC